MDAEITFQPAGGRGSLRGLGTLVDRELKTFWGTRTWWVNLAVWTLFVQGLLVNSLVQGHGGTPGPEFMSVAMGLFGAFGVIILLHNALVGEKQSGTAAWVMSKPVSRAAFILARLIGALGGYLLVLVGVEGALAFGVLAVAGHAVPIGPYVAALGMFALYLFFFVALSVFLGSLFNTRGPVLGIPLAAIFVIQLTHLDLSAIAPSVLTWGHSAINVSVSSGGSVTAEALMASAIYVVLTTALIGGAIFRFSREEF